MDYVIDSNKNSNNNRPFDICKEYLLNYQYGIYFRLNSYLVLPFNFQIDNLKSNGLISYFEHKSMDLIYLKAPPKTNEPKVLDLDQLGGCFIILWVGLCISILVFFIELTKVKYYQILFELKSLLKKASNNMFGLYNAFKSNFY